MLTLLAGVGGVLKIELSEPTEKITASLENRRATGTASITSMRLEPYVFEDDRLRPLTREELDEEAYHAETITLRSHGRSVTHQAPKGGRFTVEELLQAVEKTELTTRAGSDWFGGVDVHHVYFQGLHEAADGVWDVSWGS
jgi:hypothetical protein